MTSGFYVFLLLVLAWIGVMIAIPFKEGSLVKPYGPFLMIGSSRGTERIYRASRKFPRSFISALVYISIICLIGTFALVLYNSGLITKLYFFSPSHPNYAPSVRTILAIPGINPIIPIGYGVFGLIIAIALHEFFHGIAASKEGLKIKSVGVLFFIVPIGAYVEVDEEELKKSEPKKKLRVYSAGPGINLVLALGCLLILSGMASSVSPVHGIPIVGTVKGTYAAKYLRPGDVIMAINGKEVKDLNQFFKIFSKFKPGEEINVTVLRGNKELSFRIKLMDKYQFIKSPESKGKPFLGIEFIPLSSQAFSQILKDPFRNFMIFLSLPFYHLAPISGAVARLLRAPSPTLFWPIYNGIYWIFWLNFVLGSANVLPAYPFDGSGIVSALIEKRGRDPKRALTVLSLIVYGAIALQFFIPWLFRWGIFK